MESNELRIGNWVEEEILGWVRVHEILHASIWVVCSHMNIDRTIEERRHKLFCSGLHPITLTTEILVKCGFEEVYDWNVKDKRKHDCSYFLDLGYLYIAMNIMGGITLFQYDNKSTGVHFNHLHELQNCVFALTQKELPITNI